MLYLLHQLPEWGCRFFLPGGAHCRGECCVFCQAQMGLVEHHPRRQRAQADGC